MKMKKKNLLKIILFIAYVIFSHRTTMLACPTYISYSDDNGPLFFEEQEMEVDSNNNAQSEQIVSASIPDDNQENK